MGLFSNIVDRVFKTKSNSNMKDAINNTKDLLNSARYSIKIVSGCLYNEFYQDGGIAEILNSIKEKNKDIKITIICGPEIDEKTHYVQELAKAGKLNLYISENYPEKHFILVDNKMVRAETFHKAEKLTNTRATFFYDSIFLAKRLAIEFGKLKDSSKLFGSDEEKPKAAAGGK
jgi:hypothetical protein